jgi:hypothetical protein
LKALPAAGAARTCCPSQEDERLPKIKGQLSLALDKNSVATYLVYPAIKNQLGHVIHEDMNDEAYFSIYRGLPRAKVTSLVDLARSIERRRELFW